MKPEIREQVARASHSAAPPTRELLNKDTGQSVFQPLPFEESSTDAFIIADAAVTAYQAAVLPGVEAALDALIGTVSNTYWEWDSEEWAAARARVLACVKGEG